MRSKIVHTARGAVQTAESRKNTEYHIDGVPGDRAASRLVSAKPPLLWVKLFMFIIISIFFLAACDETPTTLDETLFIDTADDVTFSIEISTFDFDFLLQEFFFSISAVSPDSLSIEAELVTGGKSIANFILNDRGAASDIQVNDNAFDQNWALPDSLHDTVDSLWTLNVSVVSGAMVKAVSQTLQPEQPAPPLILSATHLDTLTLQSNNLVIDTLILEVTHPKGLDEIRDVSMLSLKPDGTYANLGQPIPLYDDGGNVVFFTFNGVDFTSGDQVAGDGKYSLLLALDPTTLSGIYEWTFHARTWLGIEAVPLEDSLIVLPSTGLGKSTAAGSILMGVFK